MRVMSENESSKNQINIELNEDIAEGVYANLAMVAYSGSEFVIDFIRLMPGLPKAKVKSRVVITPEHVKRLKTVLEQNIRKYEDTFGPIKDAEDDKLPVTFGSSAGEA